MLRIFALFGITLNMQIFLTKFTNSKKLGGDQVHWFCNKCGDQARNITKIAHELTERNKYLELKFDEVCKNSKL